MTREQLEHAIRAACDVARDSEVLIFGSQAILGEYPQAPEQLRASIEVDVQPVNRADAVDSICPGRALPVSPGLRLLRTWGFHRIGSASPGVGREDDPSVRPRGDPGAYGPLP